jgi:hypothetical protein
MGVRDVQLGVKFFLVIDPPRISSLSHLFHKETICTREDYTYLPIFSYRP